MFVHINTTMVDEQFIWQGTTDNLSHAVAIYTMLWKYNKYYSKW